MIVLGLLILSSLAFTVQAVCTTTRGKTCLADHPYAAYNDANPCFVYEGSTTRDVCFYDATITTGISPIENCDCSIADCNCRGPGYSGSPSPSSGSPSSPSSSSAVCANQDVPKNPSCQLDQTLYCPLGEDNTMCQYCGVNTENCGEEMCSRGITDPAEKAIIIDRHNELRRKVAKGKEKRGIRGGKLPKAANMNEVVWDDEVAKVAQMFTDQCASTPHDVNRNMPNGNSAGMTCGQNCYKRWSPSINTDKSLKKAVDFWYDEVDNFDKKSVKQLSLGEHHGQYNNGQVLHFTQVIWADVSKVGCGYTNRKDASDGRYYEHLCCNYCTAGNYPDREIYKKGRPASKCPADHPMKNKGLCKALPLI